MINNIDEKDDWFSKRWGKFTASMIYKILPTGKDGRGFSITGNTYIEEKALESMTVFWERPELEFVESLFHGKMYEEPAYNRYVEATKNYNMKYFGSDNPVFLDHNEYSGGSPDGLMGEGQKIYLGLETKCPKNPKNHYLYLKMKSQWDLKEKRIEYYAQIQFLLSITGAEEWHFCSYDERWIDPKLRIKVISVLPDKKFQDNLEIRLQLAHKERLKIIEDYKKIVL